ncbi:hypothetical protein SCHPADRAFT_886901 [Schizopora paradoxa]|uniref:DUF6533 domain-containing protein n=1 Tax=Schizopora paradoxa TaxID=27342 RepID=A0A0H2S0Q7_9AGAM|nr:hypothetical protein SCHPADRAFT_886901 [Schizopora paradoxa]
MNANSTAEQDAVKVIVNTIGDIRKFNSTSPFSELPPRLVSNLCSSAIREVEFVWKSNWSWGKVLYILSRYGTVFNQAAGIPFWLVINPSFNYCKWFFRIDVWFTYGFACIVAYVTGVRTYALCSGQKGIKWLIGSMFLMQFVVVIGSFVLYEMSTKFTRSPFMKLDSTGVSCLFTITTSPRLAQILSFAAAAVYEIALWLVSSARALQFMRQGKSRLVAIVFRDNLAYVTLVTSSAVVTVFLWLFIPEDHSVLRSTLANVSQVVGSVICSRMLLHLRSYLQDPLGNETESDGLGGGGGGGVNIGLGKMSLTTINFGNDHAPLREENSSMAFRSEFTTDDRMGGTTSVLRRITEDHSSSSGRTSTLQMSSYSSGDASSATCIAGSSNV